MRSGDRPEKEKHPQTDQFAETCQESRICANGLPRYPERANNARPFVRQPGPLMTNDPKPAFALTASRGFPEWLHRIGGSLAFSTYQGGKLFFLGLGPDGRLSVFERSFPRPMGLVASPDAQTMFLATQVQIYRFDNAVAPEDAVPSNAAHYLPNQTWITGDLDVHDIGLGEGGRPIFVCTRFNCLAETHVGHNFRPIWQPPFISRFTAEDRCHLNGMAMEGLAPRYVTCVSRSDVIDGWRDRRQDSGVVLDVESGECVAGGLSMPHSPRLYRGKLWLLNSGTGEFGWIDPADSAFTPVAFCPGYARGLCFVGDYAVVGLSLPRENQTFEGLALDAALERHDAEPRCGLLVIDLRSGDAAEWVRIEGIIQELYDVIHLPGVRQATAVGIQGAEIQRTLSIALD